MCAMKYLRWPLCERDCRGIDLSSLEFPRVILSFISLLRYYDQAIYICPTIVRFKIIFFIPKDSVS